MNWQVLYYEINTHKKTGYWQWHLEEGTKEEIVEQIKEYVNKIRIERDIKNEIEEGIKDRTKERSKDKTNNKTIEWIKKKIINVPEENKQI